MVNSNEKLAGNTKTVVGTIKKRNFDSMLADVYDVNTKKKMTIQTPTEKLILHTVPH